MTEEKKIIIDRIDELIDMRKTALLKTPPSVHEIYDGLVIRFFSEWDECINNIKYKRIINLNDSDEIILFYFIPKGVVIVDKKRPHVKSLTCLSGLLNINDTNSTHILSPHSKILLCGDFHGISLEDSYVISTNK